MIITKRAVASVIATGAILMYSFVPPAFAATTLQITGNGSGSENKAEVSTQQETTVVQKNDANITNNVDAKAQTGDNQANDNTNGNVSIHTGSATSTVDVSNAANKNQADISNCGTCNGNTEVTISGNGSNSENKAELENKNQTSVYQDNNARINNKIYAEAETGENSANRNTGGDVGITTGSATTNVTVSNSANANSAKIGSGSGTGGTLSAIISGNGSGSENEIELDHEKSTTVVQDNNAHFTNNVDAEAQTGDNYANDNTNGSVAIHTGNASTTVGIDNMANFNAADVSCCLTDVMAKISGNGADSENKIEAELGNELSVFQGGKDKGDGNLANFANYVDPEAQTGDNGANRNTGPVKGDDQSITTGNVTDNVTIKNASNENLFGPGATTNLELPNGISLSLNFNLMDLLGFLHIG